MLARLMYPFNPFNVLVEVGILEAENIEAGP
jgi:hypothetical protein